jgi:hypothetical protein
MKPPSAIISLKLNEGMLGLKDDPVRHDRVSLRRAILIVMFID